MTDFDSSAGAMSAYLADISQYPLLTADEERELGRQVALGVSASRRLAAQVRAIDRPVLEEQVKAGELARQRMVEANLRLVVSIARRYTGRGLSLLDLIQEGNIGLQTGIDKYDWRKGYRLSTYVYWWIRQAVTRALANDSRIIRLPVHAGELLRNAARVEQQLNVELGRQPELEQIAGRMGIDAERLRTIRLVADSPGSLDTPLSEGSGLTRGDMLADNAASDPFEALGYAQDLEENVEGVLDELPERERDVLKLHYGLGRSGALTLAEIGRQMGITRERVRQIETQALRRLRGDTRMRRAYVELATA